MLTINIFFYNTSVLITTEIAGNNHKMINQKSFLISYLDVKNSTKNFRKKKKKGVVNIFKLGTFKYRTYKCFMRSCQNSQTFEKSMNSGIFQLVFFMT